LARTVECLSVGGSRLYCSDGRWVCEFDELSVPIPRRVRGQFAVEPRSAGNTNYCLDPGGRHLWRPIAPLARITVKLDEPRQSWSGPAYIDHNRGVEPLETAFRNWSWSRSVEPDRTVIHYDATLRSGAQRGIHLAITAGGRSSSLTPPPRVSLGQSLWRLPLEVRSDAGSKVERLATWEDGPFYARTLIRHEIDGEPLTSVHEALSLQRFERRWVQALLPFRMPRRR
jgi:carotenoid 1,2-hydratase